LSGGEKSRLNLVKFLVDPPNLLLMDEPTTHLDIHTVESLTLALERYEGTLVFISHDVHFIRKLATRVLKRPAASPTPAPHSLRRKVAKRTGKEQSLPRCRSLDGSSLDGRYRDPKGPAS
jgi:ATPase subunit of ABC transporter with duplicated ATPase domains